MKLLDSRITDEVEEFTVRLYFIKFKIYFIKFGWHRGYYYYSNGTRLSAGMVDRLVKAKRKFDVLGIIKRNSLNYERS